MVDNIYSAIRVVLVIVKYILVLVLLCLFAFFFSHSLFPSFVENYFGQKLDLMLYSLWSYWRKVFSIFLWIILLIVIVFKYLEEFKKLETDMWKYILGLIKFFLKGAIFSIEYESEMRKSDVIILIYLLLAIISFDLVILVYLSVLFFSALVKLLPENFKYDKRWELLIVRVVVLICLVNISWFIAVTMSDIMIILSNMIKWAHYLH